MTALSAGIERLGILARVKLMAAHWGWSKEELDWMIDRIRNPQPWSYLTALGVRVERRADEFLDSVRDLLTHDNEQNKWGTAA